MAKGLRSKVKRANRTIARKERVEPIVNARIARKAHMINKKILEKKSTSIMGLKGVLKGKGGMKIKKIKLEKDDVPNTKYGHSFRSKSDAELEEENEDDNDDDDDVDMENGENETEKEEDIGTANIGSYLGVVKDKHSTTIDKPKSRGRRANTDPKKKLEWF
jgi:hypothetical protein